MHGLPPQEKDGDYERFVRHFLNESPTPFIYQSTLSFEIEDLNMMELKADIQKKKKGEFGDVGTRGAIERKT